MKSTVLYTAIAFFLLCVLVSASTRNENLLYLELENGSIVSVDRGNKELLNCLCNCYQVGQFSCRYDEKAKGTSPSCRNLKNGPCICQAFGCFRKPLPTSGDCYRKCKARYNNGGNRSTGLLSTYQRSPGNFTHCQDMAYAQIYGSAPKHGNISKGYIQSGLQRKGYKMKYNFFVKPEHVGKVKPVFKEGDILIFGTSGPPNIGNAPHYAVYSNGSIYDITYFTSTRKGQLNKHRDINYYFRKRTIRFPNGSRRVSPIIYKYCKIYRK